MIKVRCSPTPYALRVFARDSETVELAKALAQLSASQPGKYSKLAMAALAERPNGQKAFAGYLTQAGVTLV